MKMAAGEQLKEKDVLTRHYSSLCNTLTDINTLLPYFVSEKIISMRDREEISTINVTSEKVAKLLSHISGPLEAGNAKGFHIMLNIMKEHGSQDTKDLADKIMEYEAVGQVSSGISHHHTPSSAASSAVTTPDRLSVQFSRFVATIEALLEKCHDKLEQSKQFCSNLTISGNSNKLLFNDEQLQRINSCATFNELFIILRKHWSWEDYSILTHIISIAGLKEAQDEVELFETRMASYQGMKIICEGFSPEDIPLDYIRLSILIDKPYRDLTDEKYTELRDFVFKNLDIRRYIALPFIKYLLGSLHLEWYVLKKAVPHMIKMAQQNEEIFTSNSVVFIQVDQYIMFDYRAKDKTQIDDPKSTSSAYSSGGYDYNFLRPPPDRLVCRICQLPCRETQQSECCGSVYCKSDIDRLKASTTMKPTCPVCRSEEFVTYPNLSADREIQQLMVYCPDKDNTGCNWRGKLEDVDKHYSEGKECETECDKCKTIVKHKLLHSHNTTECPCYCPYCDITAEREVISSEHKEKCHNFPITCPNDCGLDSIPRNEMDEHKRVCPLQMIQCEFHDVGCEVRFPRRDGEAHATDSVSTHLQLARSQLTILSKMVEESNARYLESTEKFTESLSDLQKRVKRFDKTLTKTQPAVDVEVQTDVDASHIETANNTLNKIINNCVVSRMYIIIMIVALVTSLAMSITFNLYTNYYKAAAATDDHDLPTVQEFHQKTSIVLYELIDQSALLWSDKLYFWSSVTIVAPVVLKFSDFSQQKNSILQSRTFFAFTNGYLMRLTIYPSGSPVLHAKEQKLSVYLDFMKGPHDDRLRKLGYFPITKTFSIELLDPTGYSHLQKVITSHLNGCDVSSVYVTGKRNYVRCGFSQFVSLEGYNFKQPCSCYKANPNICCYLTDDDVLYFRVQEGKPIEDQ